MQVSNVLAGYSDPMALGKSKEAGEAANGRPASSLRDAFPTPSVAKPSARLAEILSQYDVKHISPAAFSEMVQKLYQSGAISEQELHQLAAIRLDLDAQGVPPNEPVNLLEFYARLIEKAQRKADNADVPQQRQQLSPLLQRLDWVEKFALIQSNPDAVGLDATA